MKKQIKSFVIWVALIFAAFIFFDSKNSFAEETDWQTLPQVHIKARFLAFTNNFAELQGFLNPTNSYQILTETNFQKLLLATEAHGNYESLAEPEVVTISSKKTQMRATAIMSVIRQDITPKAMEFPGVETTNDIWAKFDSNLLEFGPILDATPEVITNGFIIKLNLLPSDIEMIGFGDNLKNDLHLPECWKTNFAEVYVRGEKQNISYAVPDYRFQTNQIRVPSIYLYDNQTVVLKGLDYVDRSNGPKRKLKQHLLVFVTATVVDPAGNRIHTDEEMPFARDSIPPQM